MIKETFYDFYKDNIKDADKDFYIKAGDLYKMYVDYAKERNQEFFSQTKFGLIMKELLYKSIKDGYTYYRKDKSKKNEIKEIIDEIKKKYR